MKHLLLTTIAAVVLVGCGPSVDIHQAAYDGDIQAVKQHLVDGTDVNATDDDGWTPLLLAVEGSHKGIAELLILKGAKVNAKSKRGNVTPLDWVIHVGQAESINLLRKHGGKTGEELKAEEK
jgi:ankyrin repeat protein